jgi:hypothetical protein
MEKIKAAISQKFFNVLEDIRRISFRVTEFESALSDRQDNMDRLRQEADSILHMQTTVNKKAESLDQKIQEIRTELKN